VGTEKAEGGIPPSAVAPKRYTCQLSCSLGGEKQAGALPNHPKAALLGLFSMQQPGSICFYATCDGNGFKVLLRERGVSDHIKWVGTSLTLVITFPLTGRSTAFSLWAPMDDHVFFGLIIPAAFVLVGGAAKSLTHYGFAWGNFYFGIELSLAGMANGSINIVSRLHENENLVIGSVGQNQIMNSLSCIIVSLGALFFTMLVQKHYVEEDWRWNRDRFQRGLVLGVLCNLVGGATVVALIWLKIWSKA
jgi:hypothetical protein